mmetsp:Transcript_19740/g.33916  ORF Transcript_19740/g.33916 Transcript_19740/m.33916 type:complete len:469 (+) Transcript_19740:70-1476(+)
MEHKKARLKPADRVYHRIRWDASLIPTEFDIGYIDRFLGVREIPFGDFRTVDEYEGIPFHRIRYFKRNGVVVWDRDARIDIITSFDPRQSSGSDPDSDLELSDGSAEELQVADEAAGEPAPERSGEAAAEGSGVASTGSVPQGLEQRRARRTGKDTTQPDVPTTLPRTDDELARQGPSHGHVEGVHPKGRRPTPKYLDDDWKEDHDGDEGRVVVAASHEEIEAARIRTPLSPDRPPVPHPSHVALNGSRGRRSRRGRRDFYARSYFVGIGINSEARSAIGCKAARLLSDLDQSYGGMGGAKVQEDLWHVTLKYLGPLSDDDVTRFEFHVEDNVTNLGPPFRLRVGGVEARPSSESASVLWLDCSHVTQVAEGCANGHVADEAGPALAHVHHVIEEAAEAIGVQRESRAHASHLTLWRFSPPRDVRHVIDCVEPVNVDVDVTCVTLYLSEKGSDGRPIYTAVRSFPLRP